jgi:hypothetical protein
MMGGTRIPGCLGVGFAALAALVGIVALIAAPSPATARVVVGIGVPFPGFYSPYPYYPPYPAYYPYYPPPPPAYYPAVPPDYYPPAPTAGPAAAAGAPPAAPAHITYTNRPAFTNVAGQICREFRVPGGALGTACKDGAGQWRVEN